MRGRLKEGMWAWGGGGGREGWRAGWTYSGGRTGGRAVEKGWEEETKCGSANRRLAGHQRTPGENLGCNSKSNVNHLKGPQGNYQILSSATSRASSDHHIRRSLLRVTFQRNANQSQSFCTQFFLV